jgi:hypothetical protein
MAVNLIICDRTLPGALGVAGEVVLAEFAGVGVIAGDCAFELARMQDNGNYRYLRFCSYKNSWTLEENVRIAPQTA